MPTISTTITACPTATGSSAHSETGRPRPALLRALGDAEPPSTVLVAGDEYRHVTTFKHDSWAASALYESPGGRRIVCKFNRTQPILGVPMSWLGRVLARRERDLLHALADEPFVPDPCADVEQAGRVLRHCVAHDFVAGRPLARRAQLAPEFLPVLSSLVSRIHRRGIAYVDLHKRENILVGEDGRPYLIDFQISVQLPTRGPLAVLLRTLQQCDRYHLSKHIRRAAIDRGMPAPAPRDQGRPWSIRMHRRVAVPLRTLRRQWLVWIGVRASGGRADTEAEPEVGALL